MQAPALTLGALCVRGAEHEAELVVGADSAAMHGVANWCATRKGAAQGWPLEALAKYCSGAERGARARWYGPVKHVLIRGSDSHESEEWGQASKEL